MIKKNYFVLIMLFVSIAAFAEEKYWANDYRGMIGNRKIEMTIIFSDNDNNISGEYFYLKWLKDIPIKGEVNGRTVLLHELDEKGKIIAVFEGKFFDKFGNASFEHGIIEGAWSQLDRSESKKFKVVLIHERKIDINNGYPVVDKKTQYAIAGFNDVQAIEGAAQQFKQAVLNKDKEKVTALINYPINVRVKGKRVQIENSKRFIKLYNLIFYSDFVEKIRNSVPHNMFARWDGVMFGDRGEIWFNNVCDIDDKNVFKIKVTAINNDVDYTVVLMSELNKGLQKGKIYCKNTTTGLQYVVINLDGKRVDGLIDGLYIKPLTADHLNTKKYDILMEVSKRGHAEEPIREKEKYYITPAPLEHDGL